MPSCKPTIIGSDDHAPFNVPERLDFYAWVQKKHPGSSFVHAGDLFDFHAMSRHDTEIDADNPDEEYRKAIEFVKGLTKIFPKGTLVLGNHDLIPQRQMVSIGLTPRILKDPRELYGLPKTWEVKPLFHVIPGMNVLVEHGVGSGGKYGCVNTATSKRCSFVQGHTHSNAMIKYMTNYKDTIFAMNVGCGCDDAALAMRYAKYDTSKGVLACGVVASQSEAYLIPMVR